MSMTTDGLSYWQAETEGINLLEMTIGDLLDRRADELATQEAIVYSSYPEFADALNIRGTYQDYRDPTNPTAPGRLALGLPTGDPSAAWPATPPAGPSPRPALGSALQHWPSGSPRSGRLMQPSSCTPPAPRAFQRALSSPMMAS